MPDKTTNTTDLAESTYDAELAKRAGNQVIGGELLAGEPEAKEPATNEPVAVSTDDADVGLTDTGADAANVAGERKTDL
ncbi:hypothetical protein AEGHOMDF_3361 [Methylobacterium soli]|nr:hypothetical protein AEGHOMDF_3361 [Methylobacterium soli]